MQAKAIDEADRLLVLAADQFVAAGPSVMAGYPWFGEWSRDTMTSFEGLLLATGRLDEARRLLERSAATLSEGMLANTADVGQTEYNTADATLWFLHAVGRWHAPGGSMMPQTCEDTFARSLRGVGSYVNPRISENANFCQSNSQSLSGSCPGPSRVIARHAPWTQGFRLTSLGNRVTAGGRDRKVRATTRQLEDS